MFERRRQRKALQQEEQLVQQGRKYYGHQVTGLNEPSRAMVSLRELREAEQQGAEIPREQALHLGKVAAGRDVLAKRYSTNDGAIMREGTYDSRDTGDASERKAAQASATEALTAYEESQQTGRRGLKIRRALGVAAAVVGVGIAGAHTTMQQSGDTTARGGTVAAGAPFEHQVDQLGDAAVDGHSQSTTPFPGSQPPIHPQTLPDQHNQQ